MRAGSSVVGGLQLGKVWVGVQPALGLEGDPMRLLFERDLTPHPQYAAFYIWLQRGLRADAVCHLGACACSEDWLLLRCACTEGCPFQQQPTIAFIVCGTQLSAATICAASVRSR